MKRKALYILFLLVSTSVLFAQDIFTNEDIKRTISVTGSASMNVMPDEIILSISLEEYWEEQLLPNSRREDYKTKVFMVDIEAEFFNKIDKIGIPRDSLVLESTGRNWTWRPKSVVFKNYRISVESFELADLILYEMDFYGIKSASISELKNKNISVYREDVKKQAMLAAQNKAAYLLETIDEALGRVISIRERSHESVSSFYRPSRSAYSNVAMGSAGESNNEDIFRTIPLRYEIEAIFEIKN